jgi:hypothetical protein
MKDTTEIDRLYNEADAIVTVLAASSEMSLQFAAADYFRKAFLLAVASYFEYRVCAAVLEFVRERAGGSELVESFVRNKAIARQYHTWFSWDAKNANAFFGLFGEQFKTTMVQRVTTSDEMRSSVKAFLELGSERNRLTHENFATFQMEKTLQEIYALYNLATKFVDALPGAFRDCDAGASNKDDRSNSAVP